MKHIITLIAILSLPVFTVAYNFAPQYLDQKYLDETKIIEKAVENIAILQEQSNQESAAPLEEEQDINKRLLRTCKRVIESSKVTIKFQRINTNGVSYIKVSGLFYDVDFIKNNLPKEIHDNTNLPTLKALAAYIVENNPEQNDFEALLAIGIIPLEAFELSNKHCDVTIDEENNTITYEHFRALHIGYEIEKITIPLNQDEVNQKK